MKTYILTVQIESDDDPTPEEVKSAIYRATDGVPFSLDITGTEEV